MGSLLVPELTNHTLLLFKEDQTIKILKAFNSYQKNLWFTSDK